MLLANDQRHGFPGFPVVHLRFSEPACTTRGPIESLDPRRVTLQRESHFIANTECLSSVIEERRPNSS